MICENNLAFFPNTTLKVLFTSLKVVHVSNFSSTKAEVLVLPVIKNAFLVH